MSFVVECTAPSGDRREKEVESRSAAEEKQKELKDLGFTDFDLYPIGDDSPADPGLESGGGAEMVDHGETQQVEEVAGAVVGDEPKEVAPEPVESDAEALDQLGDELGTDPLSILPGHMIDDIQGQPAVNKRGYAMIAERYGIEVSADVVQYPWDNGDGRAVARATAVTDDGKEYSGWATASGDDGDMEDQLIELAETRSLKRAVSWASGVGIVSYQELAAELEDGI